MRPAVGKGYVSTSYMTPTGQRQGIPDSRLPIAGPSHTRTRSIWSTVSEEVIFY
jgi:hypothetical protein